MFGGDISYSKADADFLASYPMGPNLQKFLAVSEGSSAAEDHSAGKERFTELVLSALEDRTISASETLVDILEELVAMDLPLVAIKFVDSYPSLEPTGDFRFHFFLGNACMLIGDLGRAEECFWQAHQVNPDESAPYMNLMQIYLHANRFEDAKVWCLAGLDVASDHPGLWSGAAEIYRHLHPEEHAGLISTLAEQHQSWMGYSLTADLQSPEDPSFKEQLLSRSFHEGERSPAFLVEYTAVLGVCGQYERIPPLLWEAEGQTRAADLPWRLYSHGAQALLALRRPLEARAMFSKIKLCSDFNTLGEEFLAWFEPELRQEELGNIQ